MKRVVIYHIGDLYIKDDRRQEYRLVFDTLISAISLDAAYDKEAKICVIVGNIFESTHSPSATCIADFLYLIKGLINQCGTIICAPVARPDSITAQLLQSINGLICLINKVDQYTPPDSEIVFTAAPLKTEPIRIAAQHISILLWPNETLPNQRDAAAGISKIDITMAAGRSNYIQDESNTIAAYPGSLIQQDIDDNFDKGYIRWELDAQDDAPPAELGVFTPISNRYGFIKITIQGDDKPVQMNMRGINSALPTRPYQIIIYVADALQSAKLGPLVQATRKKYKLEPLVVYQSNKAAPKIDKYLGLLTKSSKYATVANEVINTITDDSPSYTIPLLQQLEWCGVYRWSQSDQEKLDLTTSAVISGKECGKSSLRKILLAPFTGLNAGDINKSATEGSVLLKYAYIPPAETNEHQLYNLSVTRTRTASGSNYRQSTTGTISLCMPGMANLIRLAALAGETNSTDLPTTEKLQNMLRDVLSLPNVANYMTRRDKLKHRLGVELGTSGQGLDRAGCQRQINAVAEGIRKLDQIRERQGSRAGASFSEQQGERMAERANEVRTRLVKRFDMLQRLSSIHNKLFILEGCITTIIKTNQQRLGQVIKLIKSDIETFVQPLGIGPDTVCSKGATLSNRQSLIVAIALRYALAAIVKWNQFIIIDNFDMLDDADVRHVLPILKTRYKAIIILTRSEKQARLARRMLGVATGPVAESTAAAGGEADSAGVAAPTFICECCQFKSESEKKYTRHMASKGHLRKAARAQK